MSDLPEPKTLPSLPGRQDCCRLSRLTTPLLVLVAIVSLGAAAFFAGRNSELREQAAQPDIGLPLINATAALTNDKFSMATGFVDEGNIEGLFLLDHNSGLLQCSVIYPRVGQFRGLFTTNVAEALGTGGKGGQYMMVTGHANFPKASNRPAASTIVYIMDSATGNYACYGIPFDRVAMNANRQQQGVMVLIATGSANPIIDRDKLR